MGMCVAMVVMRRVLMRILMQMPVRVRMRVPMVVVVRVDTLLIRRACRARVRVRMRVRVLVGIIVRVTSTPAPMAMPVPMMMVAKRRHAHKVDQQAETADNEELCQPLRLPAFENPFAGLDHNLYANEPVPNVSKSEPRCLASGFTYTKKTPFAKPLKVSTFPNPYGKRALGGHLLATDAKRPTPRATQSKNI